MINKQRIVRLAKFSSLTFSLVSGLSMAQQQLPSQLVTGNNGTANNGRSNVVAGDVVTQPVVVTPSMSPVQAPVADSVSGVRAGQEGVSISAAPSTGIGGSNTGNANTGGLQVQNVTVQANPEANATAVNSEYQRAEMLRQRRVRREVENETRLLERLEEGRLSDERVREGSIEGYYSSVAGSSAAASASSNGASAAAASASAATSSDLQMIPVAQTGATATAVATASAGEISVISTEAQFLGMSSFSLAPFIGYSWIDNNNGAAYRARNVVTAGVLLEGKFNQYLSFESTLTYGYDRFYMNQVAYGYYGNNGYSTGESRDSFGLTGGLRLAKTFSNSITPYVAGSLGAMLSKYNIDNMYVKQELDARGLSRMTTQFIGTIGGGMDFRVANNLSIGGRFDYQASLGDNQSSSFAYGQNSMSSIWGDQASRYRLTGSLQLVF